MMGDAIVTIGAVVRGAARLAAAAALALGGAALAPDAARAGCCESAKGDHYAEELPDRMRVRFVMPDGWRFSPERLVLIGPRAAMAADLPEWAEPRAENRLPVGGIGALRDIVQERPLLDKLGPTTGLGGLYRQGETLTAVFETEGAYHEALWRLRNPVGMITRAPRGGKLISFSLPLSFAAIDRGQALATPLGAPIGVAHGAEETLALTPPRRDLPGFDLF